MNINIPRVIGVIKPEKIYNNQKEKHRNKKHDNLNKKSNNKKSNNKKHKDIDSADDCNEKKSPEKIKIDDYA